MTNVTTFQTISSRFRNSGTTTPYKFIHIILHTGDLEKIPAAHNGTYRDCLSQLMQLLLAMKLMTTNINNLMYITLMDTK